MKTICDFPYYELEFSKQGVADQGGYDELLAEVAKDRPIEVVVLAHGWNNDLKEARELFEELIARVRHVVDASPPPQLGDRHLAFLGVLWPSKRFAERALIPGGAAGAGGAVTNAELVAQLDELGDVLDADDAGARLASAKALVSRLDDSAKARNEFVELLRGGVTAVGGGSGGDDDVAEAFFTLGGNELLGRLKAPILDRAPQSGPRGGARGGAASAGYGGAASGLSLSGFKAAAQRCMNLTTYYTMKQRAGEIGASRLNPLLKKLRAGAPQLRLHLVGHSFGGRLVTAATLGLPGEPRIEPESLTLLQAAFSHHGFAENYRDGHDGYFRAVVSDGMTDGPILVTHSNRDRAVGFAYPIASRLMGDDAASAGGAGDRFGGIGRNGALDTPEAIDGTLHPTGEPYLFAAGRVYNLNADGLILDHGAIRIPEVAYAILSAIAT